MVRLSWDRRRGRREDESWEGETNKLKLDARRGDWTVDSFFCSLDFSNLSISLNMKGEQSRSEKMKGLVVLSPVTILRGQDKLFEFKPASPLFASHPRPSFPFPDSLPFLFPPFPSNSSTALTFSPSLSQFPPSELLNYIQENERERERESKRV